MNYQIHDLAKLAGVSVRTLHYYDQIDLLKPALTLENGYRIYTETELNRLQQIRFFKELDFDLKQISQIMTAKTYNEIEVLKDQQLLLKAKLGRLQQLIDTINETIAHKTKGENMNATDKFGALNDPTYNQFKDEVVARWGNTQTYQQSMQRLKKMSSADLAQIKAEFKTISTKLAELMKAGKSVTDPQVMEQIEKFYRHLKHFYEPSLEMFVNLAQMYVADPRFKATYEKIAVGLAEFKRDAIKAWVKSQS